MMGSVLGSAWFYWSIGIAIGLPVALIALTEWQHTLRRRGSSLSVRSACCATISFRWARCCWP